MFDIDHLYLWSFDYDVEDNEDSSQNVSIKDSSVNTLLKCALTILTNVDNSIQYLYKPVDSDTKLVKDIADEIQETNSLKHHAFNFGALHEQIERKNDYITGKVGIGPFALNVTNQELTRLSGVKFADSIITRQSNIGSLDNVVDTDDNPISAWESGFINSHVDIVKDPYISKLNVNQFTYNLCNLLTRSGFGETTLWFLCQPIIREMAAASNSAGSQYIRKGNKSVYTIREEAITKAAMKILNIEDVATFSLIMDRVNNPKDKRDYVYMAKSIQWIQDNKELLKRIAIEYSRNPNIKNVKIGDVEYNIQNIQMQVLVAYKSLNSYERGLSKLVQYTKIDTRKHGKNLIQIRRYLQNYTDMITKADDDASVFDKRSLHNLVDKTWIDYKTKNAIQLPFQILGGLTYNANDMFISQILQFADILNVQNDDVGEKLMTDLSRAAITAIKVNYIVNYAKTYEDGWAIKPKTDVDIAKLFTSSNALSKRLNRLLDQVRNNPKYQRLENNYLLQSISAEFEEDSIIVDGTSISKPSFITLSSTVTDNKNNGEILSEAWEDLLEDEDPFVRNFANDLIIYAFITSGEYNGWNKMFKYIPYNWIVGRTRGFDHRVESFAAYTQRMLAGDMIGLLRGQMLDDIVGNNFMNSSIIHASSIVDPEDNSLNFVRNDKGTMVIGKSVNNEEDAPQYISLQKPGTVGKYQADFDIFKLVGFYNMNPIYAQIQKRGYHRDNGHDIYEYGWDFNYIENKSKPMAIVYEDDIQEAISILQDQPIADDMSIIIGKITQETNDVVRRRKATKQIKPTDGRMFDDDTMQNVYQAWEYMEDSGDSYPKNDVKSEKYIVRQLDGQQIDDQTGRRMYDVVRQMHYFFNNDSDSTISIPYSEYKTLVNNIDEFDDVRSYMTDFGFSEKDVYGEYDKNSRTETLNGDAYNIYKILSNNGYVIDAIRKNMNDSSIEAVLERISEDGVDMFDEVEKQIENYSELDLFQDTVLDGIQVQNAIEIQQPVQQDVKYETEEFYTKQSMLDYIQDRIADGIPKEDIKVTHYAETEDTDEYWVVEVKFSQDYKNSADHNKC